MSLISWSIRTKLLIVDSPAIQNNCNNTKKLFTNKAVDVISKNDNLWLSGYWSRENELFTTKKSWHNKNIQIQIFQVLTKSDSSLIWKQHLGRSGLVGKETLLLSAFIFSQKVTYGEQMSHPFSTKCWQALPSLPAFISTYHPDTRMTELTDNIWRMWFCLFTSATGTVERNIGKQDCSWRKKKKRFFWGETKSYTEKGHYNSL